MTATTQVFPLVRAKLTPQSLDVLKKNPDLVGSTVGFKNGVLEGTYEEVQQVRLKILEALYSDNTQQPATLEGESSGAPSPSEADTSRSEAFKSGNFDVDPSYYVYETSALHARHRKEIEKKYKCSIEVKGSEKLNASSSPADYLKVSCSSQSTNSEQALSEYYKSLQLLPLKVAKMVFPLPSAVQKLGMESKLSEQLKVAHPLVASSKNYPVYVCPNYDEHVVICLCDNCEVEEMEFRMRQLIRTVILEQLKSAKIIQPLQDCEKYRLNKNNCEVFVCEADLTKLCVDIAVNTLNPILKCERGLSGAILRGAGAELQQELNAILSSTHKQAIDVCSVVCTRAYNLPCEFVLHTVGPNGKNYTNKKQEFLNLLRVTYANTFQTAADLYPPFQKPSIAVPLVSAGIYRGDFSCDDCVQPLIEVLLEMSDVLSRFSAIYLCNFSNGIETAAIRGALSDKTVGKSIKFSPPMLVCADASLSYYAGQTFQVYSGKPDEPYGKKYKKLFAHRNPTAQAPPVVVINDTESASNTKSSSFVAGLLSAGVSKFSSTIVTIFTNNL